MITPETQLDIALRAMPRIDGQWTVAEIKADPMEAFRYMTHLIRVLEAARLVRKIQVIALPDLPRLQQFFVKVPMSDEEKSFPDPDYGL